MQFLTKSVRFRTIGFVLVMASLLSTVVWAQSGRGTLTGTVSDNTGAVVPNANVTITNAATGVKNSQPTSGSGSYVFTSLTPGNYDVSITAPGFKEYVQKGITVTVGDTVTVSPTLAVGAASERVEVTAEASQLKTDTSEVSTAVKSEYILDLPLSVSGTVRNPVFFMSLVPGYAGEVAGGFWANKVNGGQWYGTDIIVDGATIQLTRPSIPSFNYGVSVEAVQEFRVQTNTFAAEYGRTSSGIVNLVMKSGTNQLHGTGYEFLRNKVLDANDFFANRSGVDNRSKNQNDFGYVPSGPLYIPKVLDGRNRFFWMSSLEVYKFPASGFALQTLPTDAFRAGDMSALLAGPKPTIIYDPTTCNPGPCVPFAGNIIPPSRFSTVSKNIIPLLPHGTDALINNVQEITHTPTNAHFWTEKGDVNWSNKQKLSGSITRGPKTNPTDSSLGPLYSPVGSTSTTYIRFSHDYIFKPNLLNHFNYGLSRSPDARNSGTYGLAAYQPSTLGLTNVPDLTFPGIGWTGTSYKGTGSEYSRFANQSASFNDDVSWFRGRHSFKMGLDIRHQQFNVARRENGSGSFEFNPQQTSDPANLTDPGGHAWASFLLGEVKSSNVRAGLLLRNQWNYTGMYFQDDFKVYAEAHAEPRFPL